jgi:hypothetical protein
MKIKTADLTPRQIDWCVAKIEGHNPYVMHDRHFRTKWIGINVSPVGHDAYDPSTSWFKGGPIIEKEEIGTKRRAPCMKGEEWEATGSITAKGAGYRYAVGPTPLIAAMRCFIASRLGDEIAVPEELQ